MSTEQEPGSSAGGLQVVDAMTGVEAGLAADVAAISGIAAVQKILEVVCQITGMRFSAVARVTEARWVACAVLDKIAFGLAPGGELDLKTTLCNDVRLRDQAIAIDHVAADARYCGHATPAQYGFQSYMSVPIRLPGGELFGTLCAIDPLPAKVNTPETISIFKLFADLVGVHLAAARSAAAERAAEIKLSDARRRLDAALTGGLVATWVWEIGSDRLYGDRNMFTLFDLPDDGGGGLPVATYLQTLHPDDRAAVVAALDQAVRTGDDYMAEYRIATTDPPRWAYARARVERGPEGAPARLAGMVTDITDRKRAESALRAERELLRTVFDQAPDDAILIMDADRVLTAWNPAAERIIGWTAAEAVGRTADIIFTPEDRAAGVPVRETTSAAADGKTSDERWHIRKDGRRFWGSGTMNALHHADGSVRGYLKVFRDATERHVHAEMLAFMEQLTTAVLGQSDPEQIIATVEQLLGEHLGASRVFVAEASEDGQYLSLPQVWAVPGVPALASRHRIADYGERLIGDYRAGRLHIRRDTAAEYPPGPERDAMVGVGALAAIDVPVLVDGRLRALLIVHQSTPRNWSAVEIDLVRQVADRTFAEVERARAARAVAESESRLSLALAAARLGTFDWDIAAGIINLDARARAIFGLTPDEPLDAPRVFAIIHPDDLAGVQRRLDADVAAAGPISTNYRIIRPSDKTVRDIRSTGLPLVQRAQGGLRYAGIVEDVTDTLAADAALRDSAAETRFLAVLVEAARVTADPDAVLGITVNRLRAHLRVDRCAYAEVDPDEDGILVRYDNVDPAGQSQSLIGRYRLSAFGEAMWADLRAGRTAVVDDVTTDPRTSSGGAAMAATGVAAVINVPLVKDGRLVSVLAIHARRPRAWSAADVRITEAVAERSWAEIERARAVRSVRDSEARFRALVTTSSDVLYRHKPDWSAMLQLSGNDFLSETNAPDPDWFNKYIPPDEQPRVRAAIDEAIRGKAVFEMEHQVIQADGSIGWTFSRAVPLFNEAGEITEFFGAATDTTPRHRAEQERESLLEAERAARAEAEQAGRMKDEFLATLSHELRTPLNAIVGWTQILQSLPDPSGEFGEGLAVIGRNAKAQTQIIEDILDMSRIISGKLRLDVQRVDLAALVQAGADTVRPAAEAKGVRLHVMADPSIAPVSGDPGRLHQVFWNLVSNAVKFTQRGGRVQVLLERVNSHVEVSVIDTGEGIAPEFLAHVFDRFRQADASITRRHGGLGLGLSIVKQLVEMHGGSVRVKSPGKGHGATFIVALPLTVLHAEAEAPAAAREHPTTEVPVDLRRTACDQLAGVRVVAVDDEADAVNMIGRLLQECGAIVRTATNAADAFALIQSERPQILVSDIGMPGEDGYSLIRRIRSLPPEQGGSVLAIALTAYARAADRVLALEAGFQMHLSKPVEPAELIVTVAALVSTPRLR